MKKKYPDHHQFFLHFIERKIIQIKIIYLYVDIFNISSIGYRFQIYSFTSSIISLKVLKKTSRVDASWKESKRTHALPFIQSILSP